MIKNHTSSVPIERTISRIEQDLAKAGANGIQKDYLDGRLTALTFQIYAQNGRKISIRLPVDGESVYRVLFGEYKKPRTDTADRVREQADRTAWKLMQDWVEVQLSLIEMKQADFIEVFLPYVWDGHQSFYQLMKAKGFMALPEAPRR